MGINNQSFISLGVALPNEDCKVVIVINGIERQAYWCNKNKIFHFGDKKELYSMTMWKFNIIKAK